jgi:LuxR family maltose regulon positive regulatory protein
LTKLYAPSTTRGIVDRPRLGDKLAVVDAPPVLLVSAPAGFGKSTLLARSLLAHSAAGGPAVAWLSLDAGDSDPSSYWAYVLAALRTAAPEVGDAARALLEASGSVSITAVLTSLLNDLATLDRDVVLVLDDYHVVHDPEIHEAMTFLVEHLPPPLRLVIATRSDPPLPLARLRARGRLAELRAADLRFTEEEAAAYFAAMGLELTSADVATLEGRTEGWIAALQLAALSLEGRQDAGSFIDGFAGDDRHVVDYLVEEVVQRQSEDIRDFLLRTSILHRLSGPLADAVTGRTDGRATLEALDRGNLFLVPLDDQRRWYRYHHLFADMLQARLLDELPGEQAGLHRRASTWHEQAGDTTAAIDHALAAGDADRAAGLVESVLPAMTRERRESQIRRWMEALPDEVFAHRPVLANGFVGSLMSSGETRGVEPRLALAEQWVEKARRAPAGELPEGLVYAREEEWRKLPGWVRIHRAGLSLMAGQVAATVEHCREAITELDQGDDLGHGAATALMGLAAWRLGDLQTAEASYAETVRRFEQVGYVADILGCAVTLADLRLTLGRFRDAERAYRDALDLATRQPVGPVRGTPDMHVGLATCHLERNELDEAREHLRLCHELGDHLGLPKHPHRWRIAQARLREAEGDLAEAVRLLDEAEQVYDGDFSPDAWPVAAMRARLWIRQGRPDLAIAWASHRGVTTGDELGYLREFEHVTLARALLALRDPAAGAFLRDLLAAAEAGGRAGSALEIRVLLALSLQQLGEVDGAVAELAPALALGESEDHVRTFTAEGPEMAMLLDAAAERGVSTQYVARLLGASRTGQPVVPASTGALVDPLSDRELAVLRLLSSELSGPEIARHLVVSLNTVRTHTKNIYAKLGVGSRRAAVGRAEQLGLLNKSTG